MAPPTCHSRSVIVAGGLSHRRGSPSLSVLGGPRLRRGRQTQTRVESKSVRSLFLVSLFWFGSPTFATSELVPLLSIHTPVELIAEKQGDNSNLDGLPTFGLSIADPLVSRGNYELYFVGEVQYQRKQFLNRLSQNIRFETLQLLVGLQLRHNSSFFIEPGFNLYLGQYFVSQVLEGVYSQYHSPMMHLGPVFFMLPKDELKDDVFLGVSFAIQYYTHLFSSVPMNGMALTLGFHFGI